MRRWLVPESAGRAALAELESAGWPDELRKAANGLFDADWETRQDAYDALLDGACHQGTLGRWACAIVPFLAAFAADSDAHAQHRTHALALLVLVAEAVARGDPSDVIAGAARDSLMASEAWLDRAAHVGPESVARGVAWIREALRLERRGPVQTEAVLADLPEDLEPAPEPNDDAITRELEAYARTLRGASYAEQSRALGRAEYFLGRAPECVVLVAQAADRNDVEVRRRWLLARAHILSGSIEQGFDQLRSLVADWLAPALPGGVNQALRRREMIQALEELVQARPNPETQSLLQQVRDAPEPAQALPTGDLF